jgi:hypothetical protein
VKIRGGHDFLSQPVGGIRRRYAVIVEAEVVGPFADDRLPRLIVVRDFAELKAVTATLGAGVPVLVVLRTREGDDRRALDLLAGWALGSGGELDRIGPNTVLARPVHSPPVHLGRTGLVSAVEEAFAGDGPAPMTRDEEERLLPLALAGSVSARRRIIDTYAELATLFALRIRPRSVSEGNAVRIAHEELDRLVTFPSRGPFLASLVEGIVKRLAP